MTILRVQVNIPRDNAIPEDDAINVWHFLSVGAATPAAAGAAAVDQLAIFYNAIDVYLATYVNTPIRFKVYDLQNPEPRIPIIEDTQAIVTGTGGHPAEVAIALSYSALPQSGANPARRRGRIFLGPLDAAGTSSLNSSDVSVLAACRTAIANAAKTLIVNGTTQDARWVVFSPTTAGPPPWDEPTLEAASVDVYTGYIDNAFDTIRSRGYTPTARTIFTQILP